jgi:hypothetical protein
MKTITYTILVQDTDEQSLLDIGSYIDYLWSKGQIESYVCQEHFDVSQSWWVQ